MSNEKIVRVVEAEIHAEPRGNVLSGCCPPELVQEDVIVEFDIDPASENWCVTAGCSDTNLDMKFKRVSVPPDSPEERSWVPFDVDYGGKSEPECLL